MNSAVNYQNLRILDTGPRLASWLRMQFPRDTAKLVARTCDVSVATAYRWLDGEVPPTKHLFAMIALWGREFMDHLFDPLLPSPETIEAQDRELAALEGQIADAQASYLVLRDHPRHRAPRHPAASGRGRALGCAG